MNGIQIEKIKEMITEASTKIAALKNEIAEKDEIIKNLTDEKEKLQEENRVSNEEINCLKEKIDAEEIKFNEVSEHNKNAVKQIESYLMDLKNSIDDVDPIKSSEIDDFTKEKIDDDSTIEGSLLDGDYNEDSDDMSELQDQLDNLKMEIGK
ncbi:MAG: hypothetical protein CR982_08615 [Candidatus Cloacimonadota bacterium]|nr:MAG: hypothetical protein CR982_08615 [Candidatus Cloacimonadota bacterium]PIE78695.1 MAG: hypothetical protein CSA15_06540 [Candidatus Delongbacteria bacterium]